MCCSLVGVTGEAIAQTSSASSTEQLAFDRPEAWAIADAFGALNELTRPDCLINRAHRGKAIGPLLDERYEEDVGD